MIGLLLREALVRLCVRLNMYMYLVIIIMTEDGRDLTPIIITFTMIAKFGMTASFGTVVLFAQELYPTNVR